MNSERIKELEKQIAELKSRWPAHSVPPTMFQQLDELEEELERELKKATEEKSSAKADANLRSATRVSASPCLHVPTRFLSRKLLMRCPILIRLCVLAVVCVLRPAL
jgi:hypothetical protein